MIRFPFTALSVAQSRRRQTAYDGFERLTSEQKSALGLDIGPAHLADGEITNSSETVIARTRDTE